MTIEETAQSKPLACEILDHARAGGIVLISNHLRTWKINKRTVDAWEKTGRPVVKTVNGCLYMGSGKTYVSISYCAIHFI